MSKKSFVVLLLLAGTLLPAMAQAQQQPQQQQQPPPPGHGMMMGGGGHAGMMPGDWMLAQVRSMELSADQRARIDALEQEYRPLLTKQWDQLRNLRQQTIQLRNQEQPAWEQLWQLRDQMRVTRDQLHRTWDELQAELVSLLDPQQRGELWAMQPRRGMKGCPCPGGHPGCPCPHDHMGGHGGPGQRHRDWGQWGDGPGGGWRGGSSERRGSSSSAVTPVGGPLGMDAGLDEELMLLD